MYVQYFKQNEHLHSFNVIGRLYYQPVYWSNLYIHIQVVKIIWTDVWAFAPKRNLFYWQMQMKSQTCSPPNPSTHTLRNADILTTCPEFWQSHERNQLKCHFKWHLAKFASKWCLFCETMQNECSFIYPEKNGHIYHYEETLSETGNTIWFFHLDQLCYSLLIWQKYNSI